MINRSYYFSFPSPSLLPFLDPHPCISPHTVKLFNTFPLIVCMCLCMYKCEYNLLSLFCACLISGLTILHRTANKKCSLGLFFLLQLSIRLCLGEGSCEIFPLPLQQAHGYCHHSTRLRSHCQERLFHSRLPSILALKILPSPCPSCSLSHRSKIWGAGSLLFLPE